MQIFLRRSKSLFEEIHLQSKVTAVEAGEKSVTVTIESKKGEVVQKNYDKVLVSVGRRPNSDNIGLVNTIFKKKAATIDNDLSGLTLSARDVILVLF